MPAATPQTAARRMRSQSPPMRIQRRPVSQMHAAIATRSVIPYACRWNGPRSTTPLCGDGMEARSATGLILPMGGGRRYFVRARALEEDAQSHLVGTALAHEVDREVEVDVG